jgi:hypothetical protein
MTKSKRPGRAETAQKLANAIAGLSDGTYENPNQAVNATGVPRATLFRHLQGGKTRREANVQNQALTPTEESALVYFVKRATALGHPIRHTYLRELAEVLRKHRVAEEGLPPLGKLWVTRFLRRHPDLKSQVAKSMERARVEVTPEQILEWFRQYVEEIQKYGIEEVNIYNMDESGESLINPLS